MQINNFWKINKWLPVILAMPKMLKELREKPESGCLATEAGLSTIIQYWRSFEHLEAYAKDREGKHYPAWKNFNSKIRKSGAVGIWHETFLVRAGEFESIYVDMPPKGLGKFGRLVPVTSKTDMAKDSVKNSI